MNLYKLFKKDKKRKEPERNPYFMFDYCHLKKGIEHQGIGGRKAHIEKELVLKEILKNAVDGNIACLNFVNRRPDLFNEDISAKRKASHKKYYYYTKIWNDFNYLGYVICSDEIEDMVVVNKEEEE